MNNLYNIKDQFPIFQNNPDLLYLDSASSTQKPSYVIECTNYYIENYYSNIGRGNSIIADKSDHYYYGCKEKIASLLHCSAHEIFFGYNGSHCLQIIAQTLGYNGFLRKNSQIILSISEHHSNIVMWQRLADIYGCKIVRVNLNVNFELDLLQLEQVLLKDSSILALTLCSNVLGVKNKLESISKIIPENCFFICDASQAIAHYKVDIEKVHCDFLFFSAHKFFAYSGLGVAYLNKKYQKLLTCSNLGGGSIEEVSTSGFKPKSGIEQRESGSPNIISIVSLYYALERRFKMDGYEAFELYETELMNHFDVMIKNYSNFLIPIINQPSSSSTISIRSYSSNKLTSLSSELHKQNVCIRYGGHCAHPLHSYLGLNNGSIRFSLHRYNTLEDIKQLDNILLKYSKKYNTHSLQTM